MSENNVVVNNDEYEVPKIKIQWTQTEKITAKVISWGFMASFIIMIVGGLWSLVDIFFSYTGNTGFFDFFLSLTTGVQVLLIFMTFAGIFFLALALIIFVKKGYKFLLTFLFKIED
ncbi:MAG: hypothetical protein ACTSRP_18780 [Candidatus Helarchaeota archaeon]